MAFLAYGLTIDADVALGVPTVTRPPGIRVRRRSTRVNGVQWLTETDASGWRAGRGGGGFVLEFDGRSEFTLSSDGTDIGWCAPDELPNTLVHLLLDHVVPMAAARQGRTVLHAAGLVSSGGRGYSLAGRSGAGKSTLAATLAARGGRLLSDDCVIVRFEDHRALATPAYPGLRLSGRSIELAGLPSATIGQTVTEHTAKRRVELDTPWDGDHLHVIDTLFVIRPSADGAARISAPLGPSHAAFELLPHTFRLHDADERSATLDGVATLASKVDVRVIDNVHSEDALMHIVKEIETIMSTVGPT